MTVPTLVQLGLSPWSERARWALDHHRVAYKKIHHAPVIGERRLRKIVGRRDGPATVPVLVDGAAVLADSWAIAEHADRVGAGPPLLPPEHRAEIRRWTDLADRAMAHGRAITIANMLADPAALDASMPPGTPRFVRVLARPITRRGMRWFARKYGADLRDLAPHHAGVRDGLLALRDGLAGRPHLLGDRFTFADIVLTNLLQGVVPVADEYIRIDPASRRAWTHPEFAREFADLVQWRDDLYRRHRRPTW